MVKIYKQPFAHGGDTIAIPDASQPDGKMSSADGWTPDYQLPKTDPNYKPVGRQEMNGVFKEVTEALGQVQVQGAASWSAEGAPYQINAQVYHNGKQWLALRANSVEPTEGEDWSAIGTAATANLTTSATDGTAGRVLKVGDGGWMGQAETVTTPLGYPTSVLDATNQTKVIRSDEPDNGVASYATGIHFAAVGTWGRLRVGYKTPDAWIQGGSSHLETGWTSQIILSYNLLQTTGTSTVFPMSQKAVTDALSALGQPSMTGSATLNGTTYNTVVMADIATELGLEIGDVIRIDAGVYSKLHTVEAVSANSSIIVNYEHAETRGNGPLKLPNFTGQATVTRIAKWFNAPPGLGQAWVNVMASRDNEINYTNTTGRTMSTYIIIDTGTQTDSNAILVDGVSTGFASAQGGMSNFFIVPHNSVYRLNVKRSPRAWSELR